MQQNLLAIYNNVLVQTQEMTLGTNGKAYYKTKGGVLFPSSFIDLNIITDIEDDIIARINKAFLHLKTFYKAPDKLYYNEPF